MNAQDSQARIIPLSASNAALKRAAQMARETAIRTNTRLIVMQGGKIVAIPADELVAQQKQQQEKQ